MKKLFLVMVMMALVGCSNGFLRASQVEQDKNEAQAALREEFRNEKIYRILEEKGIYYVVKLKTPDTAITEKDKSVAVPPKAVVPDDGGKSEPQAQSQTPIKTYEKKLEIKSEMPKGDLLGRASRQQARATSGPAPDPPNDQSAKTKEHSENVNAFGDNIKKAAHVTEKKFNKEVTAPNNSKLGKAENRIKPLEDHSSLKDRSEITIFFPQDRAILLKGAPEHNRLNSFADSISREAGGKKLFFALMGSASAKGDSDYNRRLSLRRAEFVKKVLDGLLVNVPHEFHKVYGLGDSMSPKVEDKETNEKYQSVRIIAVYDIKEFPERPGTEN